MIPMTVKRVHPEQQNAILKLQQNYKEASAAGEALKCQRGKAAQLARENWEHGRSQDYDDEERLLTAAELYYGGRPVRELAEGGYEYAGSETDSWSRCGSQSGSQW
jgi:hypothetical protein